MRLRRSIAVAASVLATGVAVAQPPPRSWGDLSPRERERAWRNYQRFETLPPARRESLEQRYQRFRAMPPDERARVRRNYETYRGLPPDGQREFREKSRRWKKQER